MSDATAILAANDCPIVQGYLYGPPMPMAAMLELASTRCRPVPAEA